MIHIQWPWMALLLPLPWLLYRLRSVAAPGGTALYFPFAAGVAGSAKETTSGNWRGWSWFALLWLLLVAAAARPQWLGAPVSEATSGRRVLLAVDVSGSMATDDMAAHASRLQVVQRVAGDFVDRRHGDQVGLILFGSRPYLQAPLTADTNTVHRFLDDAVVGIAGTETAIGDAIGLAIKRARDDTSQAQAAGKTVLILLTDGQSNAGEMPPLQAAHLAAQAGLRIYTIGVGSTPQDGFFDSAGAGSDLDEATLRAVARATGGEYFRATDARTLQSVYRHIDQLEPVEGHRQWLRPAEERYTWPLTAVLLFSIPAAFFGARRWAA